MPRSRLLRAAASALSVLLLDQVTKLWATSMLPANGGRLVALPGWLSFSLLKNSGGTFSLLFNHNLFFAGASLVVLLSVCLVLVRGYFSGPVSVIALGAIAGGAAGNLIDRIRLQGVVDFIHVRWWPTYFNLADVAIRLGVLVLLATLLIGQAARRRRPD